VIICAVHYDVKKNVDPKMATAVAWLLHVAFFACMGVRFYPDKVGKR
jgi:hypothetical protein